MSEQKQRDLMDFLAEQSKGEAAPPRREVAPADAAPSPEIPLIPRQVPPPEPPVWKRLATTGILVAALAGVGVLGWKALGSGAAHVTDISALPVIKAQAGPFKTEPKDPGGMAIPDQDKQIFNAISSSGKKEDVIDVTQAKLVPAPEEPAKHEKIIELSKKHEEQKAEIAKTAVDNKTTSVPSAPDTAASAQATPAIAAPTPSQPVPQKQEAMAEQASEAAEESEGGKASASVGARPAAGQNTAGTSIAAPTPDSTVKPAVKVIKVSPAATPSQEESSDDEAEDTDKNEKTIIKPSGISSAGGATRIQLGAFKSEPSLLLGWLQLQKEFPELSKLNHMIELADLGEKGTFYRLYAGPLPDQAAAEALCGKLKAQHQGCLLAK